MSKKKNDDVYSVDALVERLRWLRLPGMAETVAEILECAANDNLSTAQVLYRLCDEEQNSRVQNAIKRRIKDARFPEINTVEMAICFFAHPTT